MGVSSLAELGDIIGMSPEAIRHAAARMHHDVRPCWLTRPDRPGRRRQIYVVGGTTRDFQERFYRELLLRHHRPSLHSHGGVRGRSIVTNARAHLRSSWIYKTDISSCFPSIHFERVARALRERLRFAPEVAQVCTRLCTFDYHLAQGFITSPILADLLLSAVDRRIAGLVGAARGRTRYTRYIDDIVVSADFDLSTGTIPGLVEAIIRTSNFRTSPEKRGLGPIEDIPVTNLTLARGGLDVRADYVTRISDQMAVAHRLADGERVADAFFYTREQVLGRILFAASINARHRAGLMAEFESIDWDRAHLAALEAGLIIPGDIIERG